jgi:hypothetical protein
LGAAVANANIVEAVLTMIASLGFILILPQEPTSAPAIARCLNSRSNLQAVQIQGFATELSSNAA